MAAAPAQQLWLQSLALLSPRQAGGQAQQWTQPGCSADSGPEQIVLPNSCTALAAAWMHEIVQRRLPAQTDVFCQSVMLFRPAVEELACWAAWLGSSCSDACSASTM